MIQGSPGGRLLGSPSRHRHQTAIASTGDLETFETIRNRRRTILERSTPGGLRIARGHGGLGDRRIRPLEHVASNRKTPAEVQRIDDRPTIRQTNRVRKHTSDQLLLIRTRRHHDTTSQDERGQPVDDRQEPFVGERRSAKVVVERQPLDRDRCLRPGTPDVVQQFLQLFDHELVVSGGERRPAPFKKLSTSRPWKIPEADRKTLDLERDQAPRVRSDFVQHDLDGVILDLGRAIHDLEGDRDDDRPASGTKHQTRATLERVDTALVAKIDLERILSRSGRNARTVCAEHQGGEDHR